MKKTNKFFAIFFAMYFTLYQYKYIQIVLFVLLGIYVFSEFVKNKKYIINKENQKKYLLLIGWFGIFVLLSCMSKMWAIGINPESRTITTLLRMLYVGIMIFSFCDSKEKVISIIKAYIFGVFIMSLIVIILTPTSYYGNEFYFGKIISQHRNTIGTAAAESIIFIFLLDNISVLKHKKILTTFFLFIIIISGSRGAIVELLFFLGVYFLLNIKKKKTYMYFLIFIVLGIIVYLSITNIPYLYDTIYVRFVNMINTITGSTMTDGSTYSRSLMKKIALDLFKIKPLLGNGVDGYEVYLLNNPQNYGYTFSAIYSHCNYTEIAANLGIIGLIIWYYPLINVLKKGFHSIKNNIIVKYLICMLVAIIFADIYRIPWAVDVTIFSYFIVLVSMSLYNNDLTKKEKRNNQNNVNL